MYRMREKTLATLVPPHMPWRQASGGFSSGIYLLTIPFSLFLPPFSKSAIDPAILPHTYAIVHCQFSVHPCNRLHSRSSVVHSTRLLLLEFAPTATVRYGLVVVYFVAPPASKKPWLRAANPPAAGLITRRIGIPIGRATSPRWTTTRISSRPTPRSSGSTGPTGGPRAPATTSLTVSRG